MDIQVPEEHSGGCRMPGEITQLLAEVRSGNRDAESRLASVVYHELHRMASRYMHHERPDHSLQATILVHEAYLQLVNQEERNWQNRSHLFALAAQIMRRILIDHARTFRRSRVCTSSRTATFSFIFCLPRDTGG